MSNFKNRLLAGCLALVCASAGSTSWAQTGPRLLIVEKKDGTLAMADPVSQKVLWRAPVGEEAHEVIVSPDGKRAFVSNYGGPGSAMHTLSVVDLATHKALPPIDIAPLHSAHGMAIRDGKLFFTAETNKVIASYDLAAAKVDWMMGTAQDRSHILVLGPNRSFITANVNSASISVLTPTTITFAGSQRPEWSVVSIPTGAGSQGVDVSPDGRTAWVAAARDGIVSIVDLATKKVTGTVTLPWKSGNRLKFTPDGRTALIGSEELVAIDVATKAIRTLKIGTTLSEGLLVTPDGSTVYVALPQESRVAIVDLPNFKVTGYIETAAQPDGMAWLAP